MMKTLISIFTILGISLSAMAQGDVTFKNTNPVNAPVFSEDGVTRLGDSAFVAQLLWSATTNGVFVVTKMSDGITDSVPAPFRTGAGAGFWNPGPDPIRIAGVMRGSSAIFKVQVWNPADGTFADAVNKADARWGESAPFTVLNVGGGGLGLPPDLTMTSFSLNHVPEPCTIALSLMGIGPLLIKRRMYLRM